MSLRLPERGSLYLFLTLGCGRQNLEALGGRSADSCVAGREVRPVLWEQPPSPLSCGVN